MEDFIGKEQVRELLNEMDNEMLMHELSKWLKLKTYEDFIVMPKGWAFTMILFFEQEVKKDPRAFTSLIKEIEDIKNTYL